MSIPKKILFTVALSLLLSGAPLFTGVARAATVDDACTRIENQGYRGNILATIAGWVNWASPGTVTSSKVTPNVDGSYTCTVTGGALGLGGAVTLELSMDSNGDIVALPDGTVGKQTTGGVITPLKAPPGTKLSINKAAPGNACASFTDKLDIVCWGRMISVIIGTALVTVTAWLLGIAGLLFNVLIDHTVLDFSGWFYSGGVKTAVDGAWGAFRDIANILIIGIFVFVAISLILGLTEYGQKKMVVRVLVIAVLINFSLLFTKLIIDGSNFSVSQFHTATKLADASPDAPTGIGVTQFAQSGVSGKFIQFMGVDSVTKAYGAFSNGAFGSSKNNYADANGWLALLHGLVAATFLLVAAIVLLYGCFLLASRALLLLFLMFTASIAFASYLVPTWETSSYGWKTWWSSLIRCAVFAPLLMLFLWISLKVGEAVKAQSGGGGLGDLLTNPDVTNLDALFAYVVVVGILFISLRISSVFSSKIAGFSMASMAAFAPVGMANRLAAFGLRQTVGRGFAKSEELAGAALKRSRDRLATLPQVTAAQKRAYNREAQKAAGLARAAGRYGRAADSRMNVMDTGAAKAVTEGIGIKGFLTGQSAKATKSYAGAVKAQAEAAAKIAARVAPSNKDLDDARDDEKKRVYKEAEDRKKQMKTTLDAARITAAATKQSITHAEEQRNNALAARDEKLINTTRGNPDYTRDHAEIDDAKAKKQTIETIRAEIEREVTQISRDPAQQETLRKQLQESRGARESDMRHEEARIKAARERITERAMKNDAIKAAANIGEDQRNVDVFTTQANEARTRSREAEGEVTRLEGDSRKFEADLKTAADDAGKKIRDAMIEGGAAVAHEIGRRQTWFGNKERTGTAAEKIYRAKNTRSARVTRDLAQILKEEGETPATPPPTPGTT